MLHVPTFDGGVVLAGSPDQKRSNELLEAEGFDIGERGALVLTSTLSDLTDVLGMVIGKDAGGGELTEIWALEVNPSAQGARAHLIAAGTGPDAAYTIFIHGFNDSVIGDKMWNLAPALVTQRVNVTFATMPLRTKQSGILAGAVTQWNPTLVCFGARLGNNAKTATIPGVYAVLTAGSGLPPEPLGDLDALGTGANSQDVVGTKGKQLYFRGIFVYNNHVFGWGFDSNDANGNGPNRIMFSNLGQPFKWGFDATPGAAVDRDFADSDAFEVGGAGITITGAFVWAGKAWIGTDVGLYFVEGFGRESFKTNGAVPIANSANVLGPRAMAEGVDRLLHGVGSAGHWVFNGADTVHPGRKLFDKDQKSNGWWDLIWNEPTRAVGYPGRTNQDLVWMLSVPQFRQMWIVIPFCNATLGYGPGVDTVIIKYNVDSGGYTKQTYFGGVSSAVVSAGVVVTPGVDRIPSALVARPSTALGGNLFRYGYRASGAASPTSLTGSTAHGVPAMAAEYIPHGPAGVGVNRRVHLTMSWESAAVLPIKFTLFVTIDGKLQSNVLVTVGAVAPVGPSNGDVWVDTSGSDTNIGNGTAGALIPSSSADFIVKVWNAGWNKWVANPVGGEQGTRVTFPIAYDAKRGTRVKVRVVASLWSGRFQIEGLGVSPATIRSDR